MDPNAALEAILYTLQTGKDFNGAVDSAYGLADWLRKGGFAPKATLVGRYVKATGTKPTARNLEELAERLDDDVDPGLPFVSMTYGEMPGKELLRSHYNAAIRGRGAFHYDMRSHDADIFYDAGLDAKGTLDFDELFSTLKKLVHMFSKGNDDAGDLAAGILETLNIEWV